MKRNCQCSSWSRSWPARVLVLCVAVLLASPGPSASQALDVDALAEVYAALIDSLIPQAERTRGFQPGSLRLRLASTPAGGSVAFSSTILDRLVAHPTVLDVCERTDDDCEGSGRVMLLQIGQPELSSAGMRNVLVELSGDDGVRGRPDRGFFASWRVRLELAGTWQVTQLRLYEISPP